ncbi:hypothetical protein ACIQOV_17150, partial [Kitasatospora sp. NPDC091257]|uniref:hypothetical protein n=1 Tax=Kitasatospora sp. NPDC091257 TaxID=3364084 RepID=UPI003808FC33
MQWGPDDQENEPADESGYLRELAAFLSARSGGGPAVLWTDYEPPVTSACAVSMTRMPDDDL